MNKRWKRILKVGALALASLLLILIAFSLYVYFHKAALKGYIEKTLSKRPGLTVTISRLNYRFSPLRVEADSVKAVFVSVLGRAEIVVDRAEAAGSLARILSNTKPFLDTLTVSGLRIEFAEDPNAPPSGPIDVRGLARMISGYLEYVADLTICGSTVHLGLPVEGMDIGATGIDISGSGGGKTALAMTVGHLDFVNNKPRATLSAGFKCEAVWPRADPFWLEGKLDLSASSISLPDKEWNIDGFGLTAGFGTDGKDMSVSPFALDLPGLLELSGSAQAGLGKDAAISVNSKLDLNSIASAKDKFSALLPPDLPAFSVDGPLHWEGAVRREASAGAAKILVDGTLHLPSVHLAMKQTGLSVEQMLRAELRLRGEPPGLRANGLIEGSGGEVTAGSLRAGGVSFRLPVEIEGSRVSLQSFKAQARQLILPAGKETVKLDGVSIAGGIKYDYAGRTAVSDSLTAEVPHLGTFQLNGKAAFGVRPDVSLNLTGRKLEIADILKYFSAFAPQAVTAWQPGGEADISLEVRNGPPGSRRHVIQGTVNVTKAAFQDAAGAIVSEGLEPRLQFKADVLTPADPFPFSVKLDLAKGEFLWKDAYFNWQNEPVRLEVEGEFDPGAGRVRNAGAVLFFAPIGELRAKGEVTLGPPPRLDLRLAASTVDLSRLTAFLGKMKPSQPSTLEVRGKVQAEADVFFESAFKVRGKIKLREGEAKKKDGSFSLAGIEADFPFLVSTSIRQGDESKDYSVAPGYVLVKEVKTGAAAIAPLRLDFLAVRNIFFLFPVELNLWGADLRLSHSILFIDPAPPGFRGTSTLTLTSLDFSKLPFNSPTFKLTGQASIPESGLEISPREFRFKGRMLANIFGGRMTLDDLRVTDVFSPGRRILLRAEIAGLDLGRLTDAVPFGDVTGIVDVSLQDLALSYGQPERFALTIKSVPTKGVPRKFSLKAVDNLSVISSGGQAAAPSRSFLTKFVHSFNYSRIGIACSLKNDVFALQGTIIEGGVQYLVRRATFFGIDVVNAKPVNKISFKDMLGRLERVGQSEQKK